MDSVHRIECIIALRRYGVSDSREDYALRANLTAVAVGGAILGIEFEGTERRNRKDFPGFEPYRKVIAYDTVRVFYI